MCISKRGLSECLDSTNHYLYMKTIILSYLLLCSNIISDRRDIERNQDEIRVQRRLLENALGGEAATRRAMMGTTAHESINVDVDDDNFMDNIAVANPRNVRRRLELNNREYSLDSDDSDDSDFEEQFGASETDNTTAQATDNSTARATDNSTVQATDNSTDQATDNSTTQANDNSIVQATDNSTAQPTNNSTAQANNNANNNSNTRATNNANSSTAPTTKPTMKSFLKNDGSIRSQLHEDALVAILQLAKHSPGSYSSTLVSGRGTRKKWFVENAERFFSAGGPLSAFKPVLGVTMDRHFGSAQKKAKELYNSGDHSSDPTGADGEELPRWI